MIIFEQFSIDLSVMLKADSNSFENCLENTSAHYVFLNLWKRQGCSAKSKSEEMRH